MGKKSLLDRENTSRDNTLIKKEDKIKDLPETSIRLKGDTHSKIQVLKKLEMVESYDEIMEKALDCYIKNYPERKREEIKKLVEQENDYKFEKQLVKQKRSKQR